MHKFECNDCGVRQTGRSATRMHERKLVIRRLGVLSLTFISKDHEEHAIQSEHNLHCEPNEHKKSGVSEMLLLVSKSY